MGALGVSLQSVGELGWRLFQAVNTHLPEGRAKTPGWAPGPLLKSRERTSPPLGYPRETDSLCPRCVIQVREEILSGKRDVSELTGRHVGEIKARLYEDDQGAIRIEKTCPDHGRFEDLISIDAEFSRRIERRFPGRDYRTVGDALIHRHGTSTIKWGRGAVLTIDLTNRCNMMCNPCFMDANQVGYVHELTLDEIERILDDSISFKPRRQMSVQFSGGEPTLSPHFLDACRYAKQVGYCMVQAATNGLRFALEPEFAARAKEAGFDMAYLQFDGVSNEANAHRQISNLWDAREVAIENMVKAGIKITPVTTIVNGLNNHRVGEILDWCMEHHQEVGGPAFQPVSFTGRDESISDQERMRQRYTTSHLAHDLARHYEGRIDPLRDWFPLGAGTAFASLVDHMRGPDESFGQLSCSCHPNCGASVLLARNTRTRAWAPVSAFFDIEQFLKDAAVIVDSGRGRRATMVQIGLSFLRNFDERQAPAGLTIPRMLSLFRSRMGNGKTTGIPTPGYSGGDVGSGEVGAGARPAEGASEWEFMWFASMWFQDLWTYDFRRTEMCVIPYATQEGEISFCAYNTGVGWRQVVEKMHMVATTRDWFKEKGRHPIYAGGRAIPLDSARKLKIVSVENGAGAQAAGRACGGGCGGEGREDR